MDRHKGGLKGKGLVMPGTDDGMINAGNPVHLIGSRFNKKIAPLGETKRDMYLAQEKLVKLVNSLAQDNHIDYEDLQTLAIISDVLTKGVNFLEHIEKVLETLNDM